MCDAETCDAGACKAERMQFPNWLTIPFLTFDNIYRARFPKKPYVAALRQHANSKLLVDDASALVYSDDPLKVFDRRFIDFFGLDFLRDGEMKINLSSSILKRLCGCPPAVYVA